MKTSVHPLACLCLASLVLLATGACGGSGGSAPVIPVVTGPALFSGTYCVAGWGGDAGAVPIEGEAQWGNFDSDGAGLVLATSSLMDNTNKVIGGPTLIGSPAPYTVDAARTLQLTVVANGAGGISVTGGIENEDGAVAPATAMATNYAVAADGALSVSSGELVGGVSPSGNYAIFGGGTAAGSDQAIYFMMR